MRSKLHELLKEIAARGTYEKVDTERLLNVANAAASAGIIDLSKGLKSRVNFSASAPSTTRKFFEDGEIRLNELADEAVRKQVQKYTAGANILITAIKAGISGDPTAMLNVVDSVLSLMEVDPIGG